MSLADQLRLKRGALRQGQTVVVDRWGRRFLEVPSSGDADGGTSLVPIAMGTEAAEQRPRDEEAFFIEAPPHPELYEVCPGSRLFLGAQEAATNREGLAANKVRHILNVATGIPNAFPDDYTYLSVPMRDDEETKLQPNLQLCLDFIDQALASGGGVLVHCNAGVSRSASVVIAYLMYKQRILFRRAYERVKAAKCAPILGLWLATTRRAVD